MLDWLNDTGRFNDGTFSIYIFPAVGPSIATKWKLKDDAMTKQHFVLKHLSPSSPFSNNFCRDFYSVPETWPPPWWHGHFSCNRQQQVVHQSYILFHPSFYWRLETCLNNNFQIKLEFNQIYLGLHILFDENLTW